MTPENLRSDYLSAHGAGFSVAPLFRQSAWFRFHNKAEGIRNLFLVGAGTHPGAGLPGVLCSAKVMDALVPSVNAVTTLQSADQELALKGKSFHWARRWMTSSHAVRATRLYGFCRYVDDLADEASIGESPRKTLELLAHDIRRGESNIPILTDMLALMHQCQIEPALVLTFIDGITSDLNNVRLSDESALLRYCYQVAGTVGSMMTSVLGCHNPLAIRHAIDLGIAMQLTNICRDVQADAMAGRRYLPASLVGNVDPQELVNPEPLLREQLKFCINCLLDTADQYYESGEAGLSHLPVGARCSILVAARSYHAIGTQLRQRGNAYWLGRTIVPRSTKLWVTIQALVSSPLRGSFWWTTKDHDSTLHSALAPFLMTDATRHGQHVGSV
jgi:phytoene synthase